MTDDKKFRAGGPVTDEYLAAHELDDVLNYRRAVGQQALDPRDAALAQDILTQAEQGAPVDPAFYHQLEQKLQSEAARRHRRGSANVWARVLISTLGMAVLIGLVLFSAPLLQHLLGRVEATPTSAAVGGPAVGPATGAQTPGPTPGATAAAPAKAPTAEAPVTATAAQGQPSGPNGWVLAAQLPDGPQQAPLYLQTSPGEPLTVASALKMAGQLGVQGAAYQYQGEGGGTSYLVSDGLTSVLFFGTTNQEFTYMASYPPANGKAPLPFDQQVPIAEKWLKDRGLADYPHQMLPVLTDPGRVAVVRVLEGGREYGQNPFDPAINLAIDPAGQVTQVIHRPLVVEEKGRLALRSAAEAWDALTSGQLDKQLFYQTLDFTQQVSLKQWWPVYQPGERVDLYGYASTVQPVDASQPPNVQVGMLPATGSTELLKQIPMRKMLHVWGLYQIDAQGRVGLELQGWEPSPLEDINLSGQLAQVDGRVVFQSENRGDFVLKNLPDSIPQGVKLTVSGVLTGPTEILWTILQSVVGNENAQASGRLPLAEAAPGPEQPQPPQTGHQPGDKLEALEGTSRSVIYQEADGSKTLERMLVTDSWIARLEGPGAEGIEQYQALPVKVWGTYQLNGADPVIQVERYEPLWPGVKIAVYFGTISEKVLEGKNVFILTGDDGQPWVIQSSINFTQSLANQGWDATTQLAVEGYPAQHVKTFGGLPVLADLSMAMLNIKGLTKADYQMYTNQVQTEARPADTFVLPKNVTVDSVELVYFATELRGPLPQEASARKLQPLWRFSGKLQDGRAFEVLVKAEQ